MQLPLMIFFFFYIHATAITPVSAVPAFFNKEAVSVFSPRQQSLLQAFVSCEDRYVCYHGVQIETPHSLM